MQEDFITELDLTNRNIALYGRMRHGSDSMTRIRVHLARVGSKSSVQWVYQNASTVAIEMSPFDMTHFTATSYACCASKLKTTWFAY